ncbi:N-formylglutamate amidohydrolase [Agrobacterium rosae]|jgi:predicted N-formylglutamate amidohydrolase|uniref:N-formylglutamate amidohydrolase n=3 Tax=Agrobacterium rosae TaxID=1972867 RepID=A0AAW9FEG1_9HYPH|nr:N-formylglutamate amidohydrolase [Agrobacterium rosae]MDX8303885.1 N-formylglutamate amidohydrolase [Agrobacterium rosae]MDX8332229.1 N-formylglutamate amidohydrolase [Agrobacterium rosae]
MDNEAGMGVTATIEEMKQRFWSVERGLSPIIGTAIHDGHGTRDDVLPLMALPDDERLREEDPFTADMISGLVNQIVVHRSRFEIDLNRDKSQAVYLSPEQAWGLEVWREKPQEEVLRRSFAFHDDYYAMLRQMLGAVEKQHGTFIVLDVHSYNHRRDGIDAAPTAQEKAPDINIGTSSMDRDRWADVIDTVIDQFSQAPIGGRQLDVRENIAFQGKGEQTRFIHEHFPKNGCAIAIEFKKIFMDEWTGQPHKDVIQDIRDAITTLEPVLEELLRARK